MAWKSRLGLAAIITLVACVSWNPAGARAQESAVVPVIPDPAECVATSRTVDDITALIAGATPAAEPIASDVATVPVGARVDSETIAGVTATVHQVIACLNAEDILSAFDLFTDHAIVTIFPWILEALAGEEMRAAVENPTPLAPEMRQTLVTVANVMWLADDRVGGFLVSVDPVSEWPGSQVLYLECLFVDGQWLIDGAIEFGDF